MVKLHISLVFMLLSNDLCKWLQNTYEKNLMSIIILELCLYLPAGETLHSLMSHFEQN